ncbi:hypothetical protein SCHPADRAFT_860929 [Schizopora paradoxa]|uniref:BTB domain-containing protein n=1 Tax=Schizopora paradoxa TaxID=27342 RepID=A0A0H2RPQ3_9AGAM|nr:hypothetical protein SCHPADRAFT_860929 [Schizopora paradoxa]
MNIDVTMDSNAEPETSATDVEVSGPRPHSTLWYEDGNIVLAADVYLYRVHKSILSKHSTVLKDMFQLCSEGEGEPKDSAESASDAEQYEGVPIVRMVNDSDDDVYYFLATLYEHNFFRTHMYTKLSFLKSLAYMCTKYDAHKVRDDLVDHLSQIYPNTLSAYDDIMASKKFKSTRVDRDFHLLAIAKQIDARIVLPTVFYACATQPLSVIMQSSSIIEQGDYDTIISGREKITKHSYKVATLLLLPEKKCQRRNTECEILRTSSLLNYVDFKTDEPPPFPLQAPSDGALPEARADLCKACVKNYLNSLKSSRKSFWDRLPSFFDLEDWNELRQPESKT